VYIIIHTHPKAYNNLLIRISTSQNPIGSIDKEDLKRFIAYSRDEFEIPCLQEFLDATPTAELEPIEGSNSLQLSRIQSRVHANFSQRTMFKVMRLIWG
jgi:hypothetical protein